MRCPRCGAALAVGAAICGRCGNPVAQWAGASSPTVPSRPQGGVPVTRYDPSPYGPPVEADRQITPVTLLEADAETRRAIGYRPVELPPPPPRRRRGGRRLALLALTVLVALVLVAVALAHGAESLGQGTIRAGRAPVGVTQATTAPACSVNSVTPAAAKLVAHPQLTTGVRDAAKKDYRPIDNVTTFSSHQMIYLTFQVATTQAGSVSVAFCAPGLQASGQLAIPANSTGRYAEFSMMPTAANAGLATATILWNGKVAASLPFTIKQ